MFRVFAPFSLLLRPPINHFYAYMDYDQDRLKALIQRPSESLGVELKRWIVPQSAEGTAKVARACMALHNNNGGFLVIGFDNETSKPDSENTPVDVKQAFHLDIIQAIVSKYCFKPFEVRVEFVERGGQYYPIICVGQGVTSPVAAKADLNEPVTGKFLIKAHAVYVRSLNSNGIVSTTEARCQDWERLLDICMDNREAGIGRFLRRHLTQPDSLKQIMEAFAEAPKGEPSAEESVKALLDQGSSRYQSVFKERSRQLPEHGAFEIAFILIGHFPERAPSRSFLNLMMSSNPRYTGWPLWGDSRGMADPYVMEGGWEILLAAVDQLTKSHRIDFWRMEPKGRFYHRRALEDDTSASGPTPMKVLDWQLVIWRVTEAIAVGLSFGKALGCEPSAILQFGFRWSRLRGRVLYPWSEPGRFIAGGTSQQDDIFTSVNIPIEMAQSAIYQSVNEVVRPLFALFEGFELEPAAIESIANKVLRRGSSK